MGNDCHHEPQNWRRLCLAVRVSYDDSADSTASAGGEWHKLLTSQLPMLGDWPMVALMGDGVLRVRFGEGSLPHGYQRLRKAVVAQIIPESG